MENYRNVKIQLFDLQKVFFFTDRKLKNVCSLKEHVNEIWSFYQGLTRFKFNMDLLSNHILLI